jgi:hypothetical protein
MNAIRTLEPAGEPWLDNSQPEQALAATVPSAPLCDLHGERLL